MLYKDVRLKRLQAVKPDGRSFRWMLTCIGTCRDGFLLEREKDSSRSPVEGKRGIDRGRLAM